METRRLRPSRSCSESSSRPSEIDQDDFHSLGDQSPAAFQHHEGESGGEEEEEGGEGKLLKDALAALNILRSGSTGAGPANSDPPSSSLNTSNSSTTFFPHQPPSDPSLSVSTMSTLSSTWDHSDPASTDTSSSPSRSTSLATESEVGDVELLEPEDPNFMARVSQLPLVSGGLELYARSKASSRVVKYGAGLVESSFSAVSRPLANNLQLGQLDDFACRQLDRFGGPGSSPGRDATGGGRAQSHYSVDSNGAATEPRGRLHPKSVPNEHHSGASPARFSPGTARADYNGSVESTSSANQTVTVASRSRWQAVLTEAGGLGAAVSEESLKSLRYCLQWLLYATAHLDHQITVLRDFIASLHRHTSTDSQSTALITASATAHLTQIKHDVVDTIRKVVDVVSKYAGAALPEPAKRYVRQSILGLPVKWASAIEGGRGGISRRGSVDTASSASTPTGEQRMEEPSNAYFDQSVNRDGVPATSDLSSVNGTGGDETEMGERAEGQLRPTEDAAERVLTFAVESLDMLRSVTQIFGESVEKAEAWIERLRVVGLDRQRQRREAENGQPPPTPPEDHLTTGTKRRRVGPRPPTDDGMATGVEYGQGTDGEDGSLVRRKKGARSRESTASIMLG